MRKKFFTRLLAITLCAGLIFQPVTAYASQPAEGEISEPVIINETMEEIGEAPETVEFDEDLAENNEVPDTIEFDEDIAEINEVPDTVEFDEDLAEINEVPDIVEPDEDIAETNDVRIPIPGVDKLPAITGVRIEGDLFSWDPVPGADTYWLEVGDKRDFYLEEGMPYNIYDSFHDTFKLDYGTYTVMFYAVNWDSYRCSEVYQFEYNFAPKKTPIYNATITTDAKQIAIDGNANRNVHITGTNRPEISIDVGIWQKYRNDGSAYSDWKTFTPGTYCYEVTAYLNLDYIDKIEVRDNFQLTIDGVTCDCYRKIYNSGRYLYFFTSPTYEVKEIPKINNLRIDGDLLYWDPVKDASSYLLEIGVHQYLLTDEDMPYNIKEAFSKTELISGDYTIYFVALDQNNERFTKLYELDYTYNNRTLVDSISVSTSAKEILKDGNPRVKAEVINDDIPEVTVNFYSWRKVSEDGTENSFTGKTFTPGKYRFELAVFVNDSYTDKYELDENTQLVIDGVAVKSHNQVNSYGRYILYFYSPYYEIKELPEITPVRIEGDSLYWAQLKGIDKYLVNVGDKSTVVGNPPLNLAYFCKTNNLEPGTYDVMIYATNDDMEVLSKEAVTEYTYAPIAVTMISRVDATSDISDFLVYEGNLKPATITADQDDLFQFSPIYWEKKDGDSWKIIGTSGPISEGIYRFNTRINIRGDNYKTHGFEEDFKVFVDNKEWTCKEMGNLHKDYYVAATFISPEFIIEKITPPEPVSGQWTSKYGAKYYVLSTGEKATGMQEIDGEYYLFSKNGTLQKNTFHEDDGKTYYFGKDGKRITGWMTRWSSTYYFDEDGVMQTGFTDIDGDTYYFKADGRQVHTAWITIADKKYYAKSDGKIAKSETITKWGKKYSFDADGVLISK